MKMGNDLDTWGYKTRHATGYPTTFDKNKPLKTQPNYADTKFKKPQTIFGDKPKSDFGHSYLHYDYSDRLWQWDYDKAEFSTDVANKSNATPKTCLWFEAYLSSYFEKTVKIEHIIAGVNHSNGFSYLVFGYKFIG